MILVCPNCSTRYSVSDTALAAGRQVKCTRCGQTWWQPPVTTPPRTGDSDAVPPHPVERSVDRPAAEGARHPPTRDVRDTFPQRKRGRGPLFGWIALAALLALVVAGGILERDRIMRAWPATARLYAELGFPAIVAVSALEFRNVSPNWHRESGVLTLVLEGEIANTSDGAQPVPPIRVVLRDSNDAEIETYVMSTEVESVGPGETVPFRLQLEQLMPEAAGIALSFAADATGPS